MPRPGGTRTKAYQPDNRLVARAVEAIVRSYDPLRVIVFGSFARGDTHEGSDLDLIVVKDTDERFFDRIGRVRDAARGLGLDVQPLVYTPTEMGEMLSSGNSFLETALAEGAVAYERDATGERLARLPSHRRKGRTAPSLR
jgi:predicted nucleotidyltransferase